MVTADTLRKAWAILSPKERRNAGIVLGVVVLAAISAVAMIGSIMPFLAVLSDTGRIEATPALAWAYEAGGFESNYAFLMALGLASIAVILVSNLMQILRVYAVTRFSLMRIHTVSHRLLTNYLSRPYRFFLEENTGDMETQVLAEAQMLVRQFFRPFAEVVAASVTIIAIILFLIWANPMITIAAFVLISTVYGGTMLYTRQMVTRLGKVRAESNAERFRIAGEALGGVKEIKVLGRERAYVQRYAKPSHRMARSITVVNVLAQVPQFLIQALAFGGMVVLCLVLLDPNDSSPQSSLATILPVLGLFAVAGQRLIPELSRAYANFTQLTFATAAVDSVYTNLMEWQGLPGLPATPPAPIGLKKGFVLDGVAYRYSGSERANLSDISLTIKAGERIGIVGSTGSGKSTLANIILGLLTPNTGKLVVDGVEVTPDNMRGWQRTIGYVAQDIFLSDATVSENVALGVKRSEIDLDAVKNAATIARLDEFVTTELPEQYDAMVGERGVRLSGGQRQRIGIARAMYHDADLILLDEATSALDNVTEMRVMEAIESLPGEKTLIMIAHRLSTLKSCDRIIVLNKGQIVSDGPWDAVLEESEEFRKMAAASATG